MNIVIESDRELIEGFLPCIVSVAQFPHRIVTARYQFTWESDALFDEANTSEIVPIYHALFDKLGLRSIDSSHEWSELSLRAARYLVYKHVRQSQAYGTELRTDADAQATTAFIAPDMQHTRFFSNHDVIERDGAIVNYVCPGDQLTDHTFEFGIVTIRPKSLVLFLTCDED